MTTTASWARAARSSALALALAGACASSPPPLPFAVPARVGRGQPVAQVVACVDGNLDLATLRGVAVLVVAFTTDNLASQALLRHVDRVAAAHPGAVAAVALAGDRIPPREMATILGAYRDIAGLAQVRMCAADDPIRLGESDFGRIERVPTLFLLNRAGAIARRVEDLPSREALEDLVAPALPPGR